MLYTKLALCIIVNSACSMMSLVREVVHQVVTQCFVAFEFYSVEK